MLGDGNGCKHSYFGSQQGDFMLQLNSVSARRQPSGSAEILQV